MPYIPSVALLVLGHYILSGNRKLGLGLLKLSGSENPQRSVCSSMLVLQRLDQSILASMYFRSMHNHLGHQQHETLHRSVL